MISRIGFWALAFVVPGAVWAGEAQAAPTVEGSAMHATLKVGDALPDVSAINELGEKVALSSFKGHGVVLYFFPKADTPGCTAESCGFRDDWTKFEKKGYVILGASRDAPAALKAFKEKHNLNFPLLSDPQAQLAGLFGFAPGERSTAVLGPDGRVEQILAKVTWKTHVGELLNTLATEK